MSMADKIAVMNQGVIEQFGTPREIYDRPATMFVADFIGSPPMNFLPFDGGLANGAKEIVVQGARSPCPGCERIARATWRSASGPSTSASTMPSAARAKCSAPNISAPRRSSSVTTGGGVIKARIAGRSARRGRRPSSAWRSSARGSRSSTRRPAGRSAPRLMRPQGRRSWLTCASRTSPNASAIPAPSTTLDLDIADGEFVVLLGPTGAGKTTTLRLIAGLERPDAGRIHIGGAMGRGWPRPARDVAFVFQQYSLYPHLSVFDNLAFPLRSPGTAGAGATRSAAGSRRRQSWCASTTSSQNRATQLSGGEMQRVAIGRALVRQPSIYLMDEPLSSLDAKLRADLRLELKRIQQELGATMLYVTHDQIEAMTMADRIGILERGRLVQIGTPREIYENPINAHVAARLGQPAINLLPRGLLPDAGLPDAAPRPSAPAPSTSASRNRQWSGRWRRRLDRASGRPEPPPCPGGGTKLITLAPPDTALAAGDRVTIRYRNPLCFDAAGDRLGWAAQ